MMTLRELYMNCPSGKNVTLQSGLMAQSHQITTGGEEVSRGISLLENLVLGLFLQADKEFFKGDNLLPVTHFLR